MMEGSLKQDMCVYISLSISQNAIVLSPTKACLKINNLLLSLFIYHRVAKMDANQKSSAS